MVLKLCGLRTCTLIEVPEGLLFMEIMKFTLLEIEIELLKFFVH